MQATAARPKNGSGGFNCSQVASDGQPGAQQAKQRASRKQYPQQLHREALEAEVAVIETGEPRDRLR